MHNGNGNILVSEQFDSISCTIKSIADDECVTVLPVDKGGNTVYMALKQSLARYGVRHVHYVLKHDPDLFGTDHNRPPSKDDYRAIVGVANRSLKPGFHELRDMERAIKKRNRLVFIVDHDVHHGHSLVGGVKHVLDFSHVYGVGPGGLYTIVSSDGLGYSAHFAVHRDNKNPLEFDELMRQKLPESYARYEREGKLRLIADTPSIHMAQLEPLHPSVRSSGEVLVPF